MFVPGKPFQLSLLGCHDTRHNDIQHKGLINDIQHNDTQYNDTQHNDTQHSFMLTVVVLSVAFCLLLYWMSLRWVTLCWASWHPLGYRLSPHTIDLQDIRKGTLAYYKHPQITDIIFYKIWSGEDAINKFFFFIDTLKIFVPSKHFLPSLIFHNKARA